MPKRAPSAGKGLDVAMFLFPLKSSHQKQALRLNSTSQTKLRDPAQKEYGFGNPTTCLHIGPERGVKVDVWFLSHLRSIMKTRCFDGHEPGLNILQYLTSREENIFSSLPDLSAVSPSAAYSGAEPAISRQPHSRPCAHKPEPFITVL